MKTIFGKLLFALPLLALAAHVSADVPSRKGLLALGCEPNVKAAPVSPLSESFRASSRKRYVFMNRDNDGGIAKFCMDEIDTAVKDATTCSTNVKDDVVKVSLIYPNTFGFAEVTVFRTDASMVLERKSHQGPISYSCTPAKDPAAILDFVINQKRSQKSHNVF